MNKQIKNKDEGLFLYLQLVIDYFDSKQIALVICCSYLNAFMTVGDLSLSHSQV